MPQLPRVPTGNNKQYTLDSQIAAGATSATMNQSIAGVIRAPGYLVIDRVDSSGAASPSKREYKKFTGVSGAQVTGLTSVDGTDQVHAVGAIVEFVPDVKYEQDWYDWSTAEHDAITGQHASLPSLFFTRTSTLAVPSQASIAFLNVSNSLMASGASLAGLPIHPVWVFGTASAASVGIGRPLDMPQTGTIEFVSVSLDGPVSGASLIFDLNKNFTSVFEAGTRPTILGGGTFVSTASLLTKAFSQGDFFSVDLDAGGSFKGASVKFRAR